MESLFKGERNEELISESILNDLNDKKFKIENISLIKLNDSYACDVVVEDKKGHRSYLVRLEKNSRFKHLYKISEVRGQKIVSPYQWREIR